jgi:hypothetical protein
VCFISIYLAIILDKFLSTHMLVISPSARSSHAGTRVALTNFARANRRTSLLFTWVFF